MTSLTFQSRSHQTSIDRCFFVDSKSGIPDVRVGDIVTISFDVDLKIADAINSLGFQDMQPHLNPFTKKGAVHIPFTVLERRHGFSFLETAQVSWRTSGITLEAQTGYWEDVFLWICLDKMPEWFHRYEASYD